MPSLENYIDFKRPYYQEARTVVGRAGIRRGKRKRPKPLLNWKVRLF
jgi:hypothetical protein